MTNQIQQQVCGACGRQFDAYCAFCASFDDVDVHVDPHAESDAFVGVRTFVDPATAFKASTTPPALPPIMASNCGCCGATLTDAFSQEIGIGPVCRETHSYELPEGRTQWALVLEALGTAPEDVYAAAIRARTLREDSDGLIGGKALANFLIHRLALARSGLVQDSVALRCAYIAAISALGFYSLAERIVRSGVGVHEYAVIEECATGARIAIMRGTKERRSLAYDSVEKALASCRAVYALTISGGKVFGRAVESSDGDWYVNAKSGESVRMAFPGEPATRPGLEKVQAWDYFARREVA